MATACGLIASQALADMEHDRDRAACEVLLVMKGLVGRDQHLEACLDCCSEERALLESGQARICGGYDLVRRQKIPQRVRDVFVQEYAHRLLNGLMSVREGENPPDALDRYRWEVVVDLFHR